MFLSLSLMLLPVASGAQVMSFEKTEDLFNWKAEKGKISLSSQRYKLGETSLKIDWQPGAEVVMLSATGAFDASRSRNGGVTLWIYDESSAPADLQLVFLTTGDKEVCRLPFRLGYKGWRCLWARFAQDMGKKPHDIIGKMKLVFPETSGTLYLDMLEFTSKVSWKLMSDAHVSISRKSFGMVPDIMRYRSAEASQDMIPASQEQIDAVSDRLKGWCLGTGRYAKDKYVRMRVNAEKTFIESGLSVAGQFPVSYNDDGTPAGQALFPLDAPDPSGVKLTRFRTVNEKVLLPLALDYHKNGNKASLEKAAYIYDWFNDQGWADGSCMGTVVLEKLRSAGYIWSYFLLGDMLSPEVKERERNTMNWFTMFGHCYDLNDHGGANSDDLRALACGKLIYALSIEDHTQRQVAMTAFKRYMDKAFAIAPGVHDVIKDDYSGYHHRTAYNSGYYPQALYAGALMAWLLHGTPYALSQEAVDNMVNALKTLHFQSASLEIPAGTVGRFPEAQKILHEIVPAYAYMALCTEGRDADLLAIFDDLLEKSSKDPAWAEYVTKVNADMSYMTTVGEMETVAEAAAMNRNASDAPMKTGALFLPYSGLLVSKDADVHFNVKGYSRYIWDYEGGGTTQNIYGRWISNGHLEFFDFRNGNRSFRPSEEMYDWNHISGTTSRLLPPGKMKYDGTTTDHRNYSDQSFLAGVHGAEKVSMFSVRLHDIYSDTSFRADKSYFFFDDAVLCIGSGITSADRRYPVVTTLFQDFRGAGKQKGDALCEDASFAYVVREGNLSFSREGKYSKAFIDHGAAPRGAGYEYLIVKDKGSAGKFAGEEPAVKVLRKDDSAHIVVRDKVTCAALFKADVPFEGMLVESVNIPLAYVLEDRGDGSLRLSLCEPDMRRSWKLNMNDLTEKEVVEEEKAFDTVLILDGEFVLVCDAPGVSVEASDGKTKVSLTTVRARNYTMELKQR